MLKYQPTITYGMMIALRKRNFTLPLNGFETQDRALSYDLLFVYLQSSFHATLTLFCLSTKDILGRRDEFAYRKARLGLLMEHDRL